LDFQAFWFPEFTARERLESERKTAPWHGQRGPLWRTDVARVHPPGNRGRPGAFNGISDERPWRSASGNLTRLDFAEMNRVSQGMIDGIANCD